jgi:nicotinamide-nucleotide amidase
MAATVLSDILDRSGQRRPVRSISVEVALLGESAVAAALADVEAAVADEPAVDLAYLARPAHVSVRVSVREHDASRATADLAQWRARLHAALGEHVLGDDGTTLPEAVVARLVEAHATVACAESVTGGGVVSALTSVPGASAVVRGGVTAYATDLKRRVLAVPTGLLTRRGPVDPDVAAAMAQGARTVLDADWGLATTGVAGPDPVGDHPVGEVHVAVAGPDGTSVRSLKLPGDRDRVRALSTAHVLDALRLRLGGRESVGGGRG